MDKILIKGNTRLYGTVRAVAAKNSVLPILAACVMADDAVELLNVPDLSDVRVMLDILQRMGCCVEFENKNIWVNAGCAKVLEVPQTISKELRSSIFMMGSILSRFKKAIVSYPGGCDIGLRPIDYHVKGLRALNVKITEANGYIYCDGSNMCGGNVHLDYPSVGATENIMMAATLCKGDTYIYNAAKEPEIVDLSNFINALGGKISGAGTSVIKIRGVKKLSGGTYQCISDRIHAGTLLIGGAMTQGEVEIKGINPYFLQPLIAKLQESGCRVFCDSDTISVKASKALKAIKRTETLPFPGFPTDLQAQFMAMQAISNGTSIITENLFETRYKHVPELIKMGADITVRDRVAVVNGVKRLNGATVVARDLRGGAALILAGLVAEGVTEVQDVYHIDRGYASIEKIFSSLGGELIRIK